MKGEQQRPYGNIEYCIFQIFYQKYVNIKEKDFKIKENRWEKGEGASPSMKQAHQNKQESGNSLYTSALEPGASLASVVVFLTLLKIRNS